LISFSLLMCQAFLIVAPVFLEGQ